MIRIYHGQARSVRLGLAVPHSRELAPPAKTVGFEISEILQLENITKRDVFGGFSLRTEMSRIVIFWHAKKSRIVIFLGSLGTALC